MNFTYDPHNCRLCPRECGTDRTAAKGACGASDSMRIAKIMRHMYEEPPISGVRGSGAVFFCGCNLGCGYCQNSDISRGQSEGKAFSADELSRAFLKLRDEGVHNINLVTAGHYIPYVAEALAAVKDELSIPVVYNSSGYEKAEALRLLEGLVDVYLPDFKYISGEAAKKYSHAEDYPLVAERAIAEMVRQTGEYREEDGIAVSGVIIRHLVLPSLSRDGAEIMRRISKLFPSARVSIMRQYTPSFNRTGDKALSRKVTSLEYDRVVAAATDCGLDGFTQDKESATSFYTPDFSSAGI